MTAILSVIGIVLLLVGIIVVVGVTAAIIAAGLILIGVGGFVVRALFDKISD